MVLVRGGGSVCAVGQTPEASGPVCPNAGQPELWPRAEARKSSLSGQRKLTRSRASQPFASRRALMDNPAPYRGGEPSYEGVTELGICGVCGCLRVRDSRGARAAGAAHHRAERTAQKAGEGTRVRGHHRPQGNGAHARRRAPGHGRLPAKERHRKGAHHLGTHALQLQLLGRAQRRARGYGADAHRGEARLRLCSPE